MVMARDLSWKEEFDLKFGAMILPGMKNFIQSLLDDHINAMVEVTNKKLKEEKEEFDKQMANSLRVLGVICNRDPNKQFKFTPHEWEELPNNFTIESRFDNTGNEVVYTMVVRDEN